jgi:outer membrane protein assembly factor BamD (BamD/ComL family)
LSYLPAMSNARLTAPAALAALLLAVCAAPATAQEAGRPSAPSDKMVWDGEKWAPAVAPEPGTAMGDLAVIRNHVEAGRVKGVVKQVERFLVKHPESPGCEEAMNLAGQALIKQGHYWDAYDWYTRQTSTYPNGAFYQRALHRQYTIADAFLNGRKRRLWKIFRISAKDDALDMLQRIAAASPGTEIAERSLLRVADHYFDDGMYQEAIDVYEQFIRENPASTRRAYAMLQVPKSYLLSYKGVEWEVEPLLNAKKRFEVFAAAYPRAAQRENIGEILEEIRHVRAHKLYHIAWFYERTKHPEAAVFYYRQLVETEDERGTKLFADTQWADQARQRLASLGPIEPADAPLPPPEAARRDARTVRHETAETNVPADTLPPGEPPRLSAELGRRSEPVIEEVIEERPAETPAPQPTEEPPPAEPAADVEAPVRLEELPEPPEN